MTEETPRQQPEPKSKRTPHIVGAVAALAVLAVLNLLGLGDILLNRFVTGFAVGFACYLVVALVVDEFDRLIGVLFDPKPAFADIAARPQHWWVPVVLVTVLVVVYIFAFTQRVGWERFMRQQLEASERAQQLPVEQRERILEQQLRFVPIFAHIQGALAPAIVALIVTGVFLFVFNILVGSELTFRPAFAVTCYAFLPSVISSGLAIGVMFVKDPADFDLQNPLATNVAALLDPASTPKWLLTLVGSFDLFVIWVLLLLATGYAAAARKLSWSRSFTGVVLTWGVFVGGRALVQWILS